MRTGKIGAAFERCRGEERAVLVPYVTAGHPSPESTSDVLDMLVEEGADVIELGVPFSDPLADGPTIQRSSYTAIDQGVNLGWTLDALARFRARHETPVVVFSYLNPILHHGIDRFVVDAAAAGADGVLLTDLPAGYDPGWEDAFENGPLDLIRLVAPTTGPARVRLIAERSQGFVYYVSRTGVTGARQALQAGLQERVAELQEAARVPVAVGFGISTAEQASTVAAVADGVVVGSALVDALGEGGLRAGARLMSELRPAMARA